MTESVEDARIRREALAVLDDIRDEYPEDAEVLEKYIQVLKTQRDTAGKRAQRARSLGWNIKKLLDEDNYR